MLNLQNLDLNEERVLNLFNIVLIFIYFNN